MTNRAQKNPQACQQNTQLTWLANMREHLVLSPGSAVILRISCSIGVMPSEVKCPKQVKKGKKTFSADGMLNREKHATCSTSDHSNMLELPRDWLRLLVWSDGEPTC